MSNATKPTNPKDEANQPSSGHRKTSSPATRTAEQTPQKCPRCDSPNTKFCYYNNYSLTQPRHFCKTCRRYWTKGGALRNVPVGGGCRKNKKLRSNCKDVTSSSAAAIASDHHHHLLGGVGASPGFMNLKLFHGISPAMDFNLGGLQTNNNNTNSTLFSGLDFHQNPNNHNHSLSLASGSNPGTLFNNPNNNSNNNNNNNNNNSLASSIESLSSINQDLHWKLQQQRLSMLFGHQTYKPHHHHQTVPILFQNLEISKPMIEDEPRKDHDHHDHLVIGSDDQTVVGSSNNNNNNNMDQWFFGLNSYNNNNNNNSNNNNNGQVQLSSASNGNELNVTSATTSNWIDNVNGANWSTTSQFSAALP